MLKMLRSREKACGARDERQALPKRNARKRVLTSFFINEPERFRGFTAGLALKRHGARQGLRLQSPRSGPSPASNIFSRSRSCFNLNFLPFSSSSSLAHSLRVFTILSQGCCSSLTGITSLLATHSIHLEIFTQ